MKTTVLGIDLAKNVLQLPLKFSQFVARRHWFRLMLDQHVFWI